MVYIRVFHVMINQNRVSIKDCQAGFTYEYISESSKESSTVVHQGKLKVVFVVSGCGSGKRVVVYIDVCLLP